ncbi:TNT domain-containing protein [Fredinandcohnia sp. QZ13]|uniref:TNT domain-containing protein n=1 Tax=Fredinandcohnia sp. QZ13 TaxID=3073144 RepID=UPI0028532207|nr:TNT domain-containing protein [Fredinandcohnia sp. QZ13]MDR4887681.1 TNT domain-containing protein [Fredinandcohnia sp. QZ13]
MAQIDIKVNSVRSSNSRLKGITSDLTDTQSRLSSLRHAIDSQITSRQGIGANLSSMASSIHALEKRLNQLHSFVDTSVARYEQADKQVNSNSQKLTAPPKKSFWESVGDFFGVVGNSVKGFATGLWDVGVDTVKGIWNIITHPVETFKGLVHVIQHPVETAKGIWDAIKTSWNEDVINGDAESRGNWFGRAFGEIALAIVGTKGVDKAVKLTKGAKVVDEVGGVRVVDDFGGSSKPDYHEKPRTPDTINPAERAKLDGWTHRPDDDLYLKYKDVYDNPKYYNQETGAINWPGTKGDPNIDGFKNGEYQIETLKPGTEIDRYGSNGSGQYFSPAGSSYESRALPPHMTQQPYQQYTIIREFDVRAGEIAPWFDEVGGGTQYYSKIEIFDDFGNKVPATVENLIKYGYIK